MTKKLSIFFHMFSLIYSPFCNAFFSIKDVSSWMFGYKQETLHKEILFDSEGILVVENQSGSIYIKTWALPKIALQAIKTAREKDLDHIIINTIVEKHSISFKTWYEDKKIKGEVDYYIRIPAHLPIKLSTKAGCIKVKNSKGTIEAKVDSGSIEIQQAENNLFLKNNSGSIIASMKELVPSMHLILEASGLIQLLLPKDVHADICAKAPYGSITSDHYITIKPVTTKLNQQTWANFKKEIQATLGGGGAEISLRSTHGSIKITES
jgi:hypothetical protein